MTTLCKGMVSKQRLDGNDLRKPLIECSAVDLVEVVDKKEVQFGCNTLPNERLNRRADNADEGGPFWPTDKKSRRLVDKETIKKMLTKCFSQMTSSPTNI